eukprot:3727526-Pyramimonas_sp.AAC.2
MQIIVAHANNDGGVFWPIGRDSPLHQCRRRSEGDDSDANAELQGDRHHHQLVRELFSGQLLHPASAQRLGAHGAPDIQASEGWVDSVLHVGSEQHGGFAAAEPSPRSFRHRAQRRVTHASVDTPLHT